MVKKRTKTVCFWVALFMLLAAVFHANVYAAAPSLSTDEQWIIGLSQNMEYITDQAYQAHNGAQANNPYWTSISGGTRPDGTKYANFRLVEGNKLAILSAWWGQDIHVRTKGSSGAGTVIKIPEYSQLKEQYKRAIRVFNAYSPDTGQSFYSQYIQSISDAQGYLIGVSPKINVDISKSDITIFNAHADEMLTDAEGNYIYDLVAIGAYTDQEPDLSGAAAWALKRYIQEGYGFLIGHDTMYGYGGVNEDPDYTPDPADTSTPMYELNTNNNGHWNLNWLMGVNRLYTEASPYDAASMILNIGDWKDKSTLYGDGKLDSKESGLKVTSTVQGNPQTDVNARTPVNYPYSTRVDGTSIQDQSRPIIAGSTHTNQQIAYGKVWFEFATNTRNGKLVTDRNEGLVGTNNFYLTTNGNFGMMQIGHSKDNLNAAKTDECRILANTILYLSQREPCQVCQSRQGGNHTVHSVIRISSAEELAKIGNPNHWFDYPLDGCYVLVNDITLPADWQPIQGFKGHFNADSRSVSGDQPVFEQSGLLGLNQNGWNLGTNPQKGINQISSGEKNITGTARIVGHLNQLFGTGSNVDYDGWRVVVTGSDGKEYDCVTNREGKYVISNLPSTGAVMTAHVYDRSGRDVTEYGMIYGIVAQRAWNSNETVPLKLASDIVRPIPNQTVYEEETARFTAGLNIAKLPQRAVWQYRGGEGDTWRNAADNPYFDLEITPVQLIGGQNPYVETTLTIRNTALDLDKLQFRVVFTVDGKEYDTNSAKTEGFAGLLRVKERPYQISPLPDVAAWEGGTASFQSEFVYYKSLNDKITVEWQFRGSSNSSWEKVEGSFIEGYQISQSVTASNVPYAGYKSVSILKLPAKGDYHGYQFRAVYKYADKRRSFSTDSVSTAGKTGKLSVLPKLLRCDVNPKGVKAETTGSIIPGSYQFTAEFVYVAPKPTAQITWEYKKNIMAKYTGTGGLNYASVSVGKPVSLGNNTYRVKTTLTLTNPPITIDTGTNHFYFRAKAVLDEQTAYSSSADVSVHYRIDIKPGTPKVRVSPDGTKKIYTYPELTVFAPEGVRNMQVYFDTGSAANSDNRMESARADIGTPMQDNKGFVYNSTAALSAEQIRDYLRQVEMVVGTESANVIWTISSERSPGDFDPYSGKYYEYISSPGITWKSAFDEARQKYHSVMQVQGQLATIRNDAQNNHAKRVVNGKTAWLGGTNDTAYTFGHNWWGWVDGTEIGYHHIQDLSFPYVQMRSDGLWTTAPNNQNADVTVTDLIQYSGGSMGGWRLTQGAPQAIFDMLPEREDNPNHSYSGLTLTMFAGGVMVQSKVEHTLPLIPGHDYWVFGKIGEFGDANVNMILDIPGLIHLESYWNQGETAEVNQLITYQGPAGGVSAVVQTNNAGPYVTGFQGQLYHLQVVDVTESFTSKGINLPTADWMRNNIGVFNGSKTVQFTSNQSNVDGYLVEYVVNDNMPTHTPKSARATDTLTGLKPEDINPPENIANAEYRTDTDIIISCGITAKESINPDNPAWVKFTVKSTDGSTTTHTFSDVCLPAGASQRAYVSFHIPNTPGAMVVDITTSSNITPDATQIRANVVELKENTPPDPKFSDQNKTFTVPRLPSFPASTQHTWTTYNAVKSGDTWEYQEVEHKAGLSAVLSVQPDERVLTANGDEMKSGYGLNASLQARHGNISSGDVIAPQTVIAYFPEFQYESYWRMMERVSSAGASSVFQFKVNPYSQAEHRVHFTPLWYPDNKPYTVWVTLRDMWTPVGELKQACSDGLTINGNVYDDWYIREVKE